MKVYVESNFVLEVALRQEDHDACERLLEYAERGHIELAIPAWSLAEPYATWHRRAGEREELLRRLDRVLRQLARSPEYAEVLDSSTDIIALLSRSIDRDKTRLDRTCERLIGLSSVIRLDDGALSDSYTLQSTRDLSPQDAFVYASVVAHLRRQPVDEPKVVVTRDADDFLTPEIQNDLQALGAELIPSLAGAAAHLDTELEFE